jgi:hypothetical protein
MRRTPSGLFIASTFNVVRYRARKRTVTLPNGERALVTIDDSGTVRHVEHGDVLDATVRPATIRLELRHAPPTTPVGGFARPGPLNLKTRLRRNP